ncbi:hypothetical protein [Azospirillum sp. Sh1]|uniref:hypothetical protein n=1 Tax=Azospirillum sp. Sh1 TaxID=2607285 RepID=UPI0011F054AF|nr:hypothetical protein [Azospirillum sp. Sh1]KAA0573405.1 hypothetical protein FZ029_20725 [Azospirillum sp. Sh1]
MSADRFVVIRNCPQMPLLVGVRARITNIDYVPFAERRNALVEVETPAGHREWLMLSDVSLAS